MRSIFLRGIALILVPIFTLLTSCYRDYAKTSTGEYLIVSVRIYKDTPAWELAKAVKAENVKKIAKIAKENPELLDYQDPLYDTTLLFWSLGMEKYKSAEALLKAGADPDIISGYEGGTALYRAANFSLIDSDFKEDAKFVKLLLQYGADPNIGYVGGHNSKIKEINGIPVHDATEIGTSPLMNSIACGIEKTKALVEGGADINHKTQWGKTAAIDALTWGGGGLLPKFKEYAHYLIVEKKAKVADHYYRGRTYHESENPYDKFYPVDLLRYWTCELDSPKYKLKMEIVDEFARQEVDYWSTEIPKYTLESFKKKYPTTWEEYIKRY